MKENVTLRHPHSNGGVKWIKRRKMCCSWCSVFKFSLGCGFLLHHSMYHETFGDVKKLVTQEFVKQAYLELTKLPNNEQPVFEVRWGQRAKLETSKLQILKFVSLVTIFCSLCVCLSVSVFSLTLSLFHCLFLSLSVSLSFSFTLSCSVHDDVFIVLSYIPPCCFDFLTQLHVSIWVLLNHKAARVTSSLKLCMMITPLCFVLSYKFQMLGWHVLSTVRSDQNKHFRNLGRKDEATAGWHWRGEKLQSLLGWGDGSDECRWILPRGICCQANALF